MTVKVSKSTIKCLLSFMRHKYIHDLNRIDTEKKKNESCLLLMSWIKFVPYLSQPPSCERSRIYDRVLSYLKKLCHW